MQKYYFEDHVFVANERLLWKYEVVNELDRLMSSSVGKSFHLLSGEIIEIYRDSHNASVTG